ncbi:MAG: class I tRNA ligase family protein, partial [Chloroflexi bacterium]|nr:class I tRNA ligase family protein [Chloroflexota bacterium]
EGTGVVHIAPGCGAEDFRLSKELGLPIIAPLDENGVYKAGFGWLTGREAQSVAEEVLAELKRKGLLYKVEGYKHRYPVCWRCESELVFRLVDEWFIRMGELYDKPREQVTAEEKAASLRYQMMDVVDDARWIPSFGRERELDWLRNMHDWMISKKRYWGLALPIWVCDDPDCGGFDVVGGREELAARAVSGWSTFEGHSPHRPYVDAVKIACPACGGPATRTTDVGNPWLDAGIVSLSTLPDDLPFEAAKAKWFPADFITESFPGQFRNWFYSLLAMSTVLEGRAPFKTVLGFATLHAEDGREMHKSWGNAIEFNEGADTMGADVMRWMYLAHKPEVDLNFGYGPGGEVRRRFLIPLWNVYGFFVQYANLAEGWTPAAAWDDAAPGAAVPIAGDPAGAQLDRWIHLRLHATVREVGERMADFDGLRATQAIEAFVEELSNWYVRRSRRRFWEGDPAALDTLYEVLVTLTRLLAPMLPFTAEDLYQNLVRGLDAAAPESVHHCRWPQAPAPDADDAVLLAQMGLVLRLTALGRAARSAADLKLRQPLAKAMLALRGEEEAQAIERLGEHLREELNVKALEVLTEEGALVSYSLRPVLPKLGPKHGQRLPAIKQALEAADAGAVAAAVNAGRPVTLEVAGEPLVLEPDEIEVMASAREGLATAEGEGYVVGLVTELSSALLAEGLARDLLRQVQSLRKDSGLDISDRIALTVDGPPAVLEAARDWRDFICGEALALALDFGPPAEDAEGSVELEIEGHAVRLGLKRAL